MKTHYLFSRNKKIGSRIISWGSSYFTKGLEKTPSHVAILLDETFVINTNLKYIGVEEGVKVDGRAPKYMTYSATYHTTKLRLIFRHSAGFKHKMHMIFELFKA